MLNWVWNELNTIFHSIKANANKIVHRCKTERDTLLSIYFKYKLIIYINKQMKCILSHLSSSNALGWY